MSALRKKFRGLLLLAACGALFIANTINIGSMFREWPTPPNATRVSSHIWWFCLVCLIAFATVRLRYIMIADILKWWR